MWASGIWDPCGQPQIYPMWASGIWDPCGQPQIYPMWASGIWDPSGQPQMYPMWAYGIWDPFHDFHTSPFRRFQGRVDVLNHFEPALSVCCPLWAYLILFHDYGVKVIVAKIIII